MGKCVVQVYFMEKWSKRLRLKIAVSQQYSYVNFSMIIFILCGNYGYAGTTESAKEYIYIYIMKCEWLKNESIYFVTCKYFRLILQLLQTAASSVTNVN